MADKDNGPVKLDEKLFPNRGQPGKHDDTLANLKVGSMVPVDLTVEGARGVVRRLREGKRIPKEALVRITKTKDGRTLVGRFS